MRGWQGMYIGVTFRLISLLRTGEVPLASPPSKQTLRTRTKMTSKPVTEKRSRKISEVVNKEEKYPAVVWKDEWLPVHNTQRCVFKLCLTTKMVVISFWSPRIGTSRRENWAPFCLSPQSDRWVYLSLVLPLPLSLVGVVLGGSSGNDEEGEGRAGRAGEINGFSCFTGFFVIIYFPLLFTNISLLAFVFPGRIIALRQASLLLYCCLLFLLYSWVQLYIKILL